MKSIPNSENHSAKKKARQEKNWLFPVVLLFCALVLLGGTAYLYCFFLPHRFSETEIMDYVRNVYGDSWTLREEYQESGLNGAVSYTFTDEEKNYFTVHSVAVPAVRDGLPTGQWEKALYDDYFSSVIKSRINRIEALAEKIKKETGAELIIEGITKSTKEGSKTDTRELSSEEFTGQVSFQLYLENSGQLQEAAKYIKKMDEILGFSLKEDSGTFSQCRQQPPCVHVYLYPEVLKETPDAVSCAEKAGTGHNAGTLQYPVLASWTGNWKDPYARKKYLISTIPFSCNSDGKRYGREELFTRLENDYVDAARTFGKEFYSISDELRDKYPAPVLTLLNVGGHDLIPGKPVHEYRFIYNRRTRSYWMTGLDPCEYKGGNGSFAALVGYLGGKYTCDRDKEASWRIGLTGWKASLDTKKGRGGERVYKNLRVYRDGNMLYLDPVPDNFEGSGALPSGRPFSLHDLIKMLDVHITVNQREMTAVIYRTLMK